MEEKIISNRQVALALAHVAKILTKEQFERLNDLDREALVAAGEGGHRIEGMAVERDHELLPVVPE